MVIDSLHTGHCPLFSCHIPGFITMPRNLDEQKWLTIPEEPSSVLPPRGHMVELQKTPSTTTTFWELTELPLPHLEPWNDLIFLSWNVPLCFQKFLVCRGVVWLTSVFTESLATRPTARAVVSSQIRFLWVKTHHLWLPNLGNDSWPFSLTILRTLIICVSCR